MYQPHPQITPLVPGFTHFPAIYFRDNAQVFPRDRQISNEGWKQCIMGETAAMSNFEMCKPFRWVWLQMSWLRKGILIGGSFPPYRGKCLSSKSNRPNSFNGFSFVYIHLRFFCLIFKCFKEPRWQWVYPLGIKIPNNHFILHPPVTTPPDIKNTAGKLRIHMFSAGIKNILTGEGNFQI